MIKGTALFQSVTRPNGYSPVTRTGGWSESYILPYATIDENRPQWLRWCALRAQLLPNGTSIVGQRYQHVMPVGGSATGGLVFPGASNQYQDIPQMALLCRQQSASSVNVRPLVLRGLPDDMVKFGEYYPNEAYDAALRLFFKEMTDHVYYMRGRVLSNATIPIFTIISKTPPLLVTVRTEIPHNFTEGQMVRILRTKQPDGQKKGLRGPVIAPVTSNGFDMLWPYALPTTGGSVRLDAVSIFSIANTNITRVVVRKVGRAFFQYRGRASNKS